MQVQPARMEVEISDHKEKVVSRAMGATIASELRKKTKNPAKLFANMRGVETKEKVYRMSASAS